MMTLEEVIARTAGLEIQMQPVELFEIVKQIDPPENILIFGLGNDSTFWHEVNRDGRTVFLEERKKWFDLIKGNNPFLEAVKINYHTCRTQWRELIDKPDALMIDLPSEIASVSWDLIIVDGPAGHSDTTPGRMKSIYTASKLVKSRGDIFVHDAHREVEDDYCSRYLLNENLVAEIKGFSTLRHYRAL